MQEAINNIMKVPASIFEIQKGLVKAQTSNNENFSRLDSEIL